MTANKIKKKHSDYFLIISAAKTNTKINISTIKTVIGLKFQCRLIYFTGFYFPFG